MTQLLSWVKLPTAWIEDGGLKEFKWLPGSGADNIAALMTLMVLAHHMKPDDGSVFLTYDQLCEKASLSRAKVSNGLTILKNLGLIGSTTERRSTYFIENYDPKVGWAKLPAKGLYTHGGIQAFRAFQLRQKAELNALKLYYLFVSRRDRQTNLAKIGYEKIEDYSGVRRNDIKAALSLLVVNSLVYAERVQSLIYDDGVANAYRLVHVNPRRHMGTSGRGTDEIDTFQNPQQY